METAHHPETTAAPEEGASAAPGIIGEFIAPVMPEAFTTGMSEELVDPVTNVLIDVAQEPARATGVLEGGGAKAKPAH